MEAILQYLLGGGAGSLIGLVGAFLTKMEERKVLEVKNRHELAMRELSLKEQEAEQSHELAIADKEIEKAEVEGQLHIDAEEVKGWATTLSDEMSQTTLGAMVKGAMRPTITLLLLGITTWLTFNIWTLSSGLEGLEQEELLDMMRQIISQILFLTATTITWWFGARASSKPPITIKK